MHIREQVVGGQFFFEYNLFWDHFCVFSHILAISAVKPTQSFRSFFLIDMIYVVTWIRICTFSCCCVVFCFAIRRSLHIRRIPPWNKTRIVKTICLFVFDCFFVCLYFIHCVSSKYFCWFRYVAGERLVSVGIWCCKEEFHFGSETKALILFRPCVLCASPRAAPYAMMFTS